MNDIHNLPGPDNDTFEEIEQYNTLEDSNKAVSTMS